MIASNGVDAGRSPLSTTSSEARNRNRRRRRMIGSAYEESSSLPSTTKLLRDDIISTVTTTEEEEEGGGKGEENGDYYSDSDDNNNDHDDFVNDDDERRKGHSHEKKTYKNACSMGQFFLNPCLCCWSSARHYCHNFCHFIERLSLSIGRNRRQQQSSASSSNFMFLLKSPLLSKNFNNKQQLLKHFDQIDLLLIVGIICLLFVSLHFFLPSFLLNNGILLPMTSPYNDPSRLSILIPTLDRRRRNIINDKSSVSSVDIGGWMMVQKPISKPTRPIDFGQPDRANLLFIGMFGKPRQIRQLSIDEDVIAGIQYNITYPKTKEVSRHNLYNEQIEEFPNTCRRVNWKTLYNPTCNEIHSIPLSRDYDEEKAIRVGDDQQYDSFYVSHGYFRDVWVVNQLGLFGTTPRHPGPKTVLKMSRWKSDLTPGELQKDLRDALVMERLTASPRIIDIYSHCGTAVQVEALPYEVEEVVVPGSGYIKQHQLHDKDDVKPRNDYSANEKLNIALAMAESLADLHGFSDGVIVHDDVQLCQWLRNYDGKLKLGDFNRAEIMDYNEKDNGYCVYNNGECYGNYRAPEEFDAADLDEKIDVFSFGNNIYALLTGLWVFYENEDDGVVQEKIIKGQTAYIDPRYRTRSLAEKRLVEIMEKCWVLTPQDRIDIFEAVRILREAVDEVKNSKGKV